MGSGQVIALIIFLLPMLAAIYFVAIASPKAISYVDRANDWLLSVYNSLALSKDFWRRWIVRPLIWPLYQIGKWTQSISPPSYRAGTRVVAQGYAAYAVVFVVALATYVAVMLVITMAVIAAIIYYALSLWADSSSSSQTSPVSKSDEIEEESRPPAKGLFGMDGESRRRQGIFGEYTEHRDASGVKIGESREREGVFGKYTEHRDQKGDKVGESRERPGVFGPFTKSTKDS